MKKKLVDLTWKERNIQRWEKMATTYLALKTSPSFKLILKLIGLISRIIFSIITRKILEQFFPNF